MRTLALLFVSAWQGSAAGTDLHAQALAFVADEDLQSAVPLLRSACRQNQKDPDLLNNLGVTEMRLGKLHSAKKRLVEALEVDPEHAAAQGNLDELKLYMPEHEFRKSDPRQGGSLDVKFGELRQRHTLGRLPRIQFSEWMSEENAVYRDGALPFVLEGALTAANGWDAEEGWSRARLTEQFGDAVADFYPHNMGDERVHPLFESLGVAWGELLNPTKVYKDVDASARGTYIQVSQAVSLVVSQAVRQADSHYHSWSCWQSDHH